MQRINLLYVITKLELGGAQKQLLSLINHLDRDKFKPFLFTAQDGLLIPEAQAIEELTLKKSRCLERPINPLKDLLALIEIYRFIKKNNIKVVHTHSSKAGILGRLAARLARAKVILHTVHGWSFNDYQPRPVRSLFICLERITARFTKKIIVVSNYDKRKGLANHIGKDSKYALIRYGIDYSEYNVREEKIREELGIGVNDLVVGMVACFKPQKSPLDFIRLASVFNPSQKSPEAYSPNDKCTFFSAREGASAFRPTGSTNASFHVKFLLVGDGALRRKIEKLISKLNLQERVILAGWRRDIPRILSATDVFVLTSLWEGLPISILEAMASSKPVVSTHTGGVAEVIADGKTGFLAPCEDTAMMSEKLSVLLKDESLRRGMGEKARESLGAKFSLVAMIENSQNLYEGLIKEKEEAYVN